MAKSRLHRFYNKFISSLSFSAELRKMRRELNAKIDQPEIITSPPPFILKQLIAGLSVGESP